jgi:OOP family OmpA-OmpF porin
MKNIFLSLLLLILSLKASIENEIGISVGTVSIKNEHGLRFKNFNSAISYKLNSYLYTPRFDLEYVNITDFKEDRDVKGLFKFSMNWIYPFEMNTVILPYGVGGVGYEQVFGSVEDVFDSHPFIQGGFGVEYIYLNRYKFQLEGKVLQIIGGGENQNNEIIMNFGMSMPISKITNKKPKALRPRRTPPPPTPTPKVIKEVVVQRVPVPVPVPIKTPPPPTPPPPKNRCPKKINAPDADRDGIEDRFDQCPNTPCGYIVDKFGCPIKVTLRINFDIDSAEINQDSIYKIREFAKYLLANRGSMVTIEGHTDSVGSFEHNMELSRRRAEAVANKLVEFGVSPSRIRAIGRGETMPIASNKTDYGKSLNRRIEAIITYPNRRSF